MSIIIKGVDMPECCAECWFKIREITSATDENLYWYKHVFSCRYKPEKIEDGWIDTPEALNGRQPWCPISDVPTPHGRLVDADALCEALLTRWDTADKNAERIIAEVMADVVTPIVASAPTIIEAEE